LTLQNKNFALHATNIVRIKEKFSLFREGSDKKKKKNKERKLIKLKVMECTLFYDDEYK